MRKTHLEIVTDLLKENISKIFDLFSTIKFLDCKENTPVGEGIIKNIFTPEICSTIFITPNIDRSGYEQRNMDMSLIYHTYHLWKDRNYFDITIDLINKLKDTDLKDLDTFFLKSPYRSMYVSMPKGNGLHIPGSPGVKSELYGFYITLDDFDKKTDMYSPHLNITMKSTTKRMKVLMCTESSKYPSGALFFYDLVFWEGSIIESLEKNKEILRKDFLWSSISETFKFILKVILYINCSNNSIREEVGFDIDKKLKSLKNPTKKRKLLQRYEKLSTKAHKVLEVRINGHTASSNKKGSHTPHKILTSPVRVRGHFKGQRYGENLSKYKTLWIKPYVRGEGSDFYRDKKRVYVVS